MASAIFFNGRRINVPGAYSKLDASGLASVTPSSTGIVALVGTAEGGKPLTVEPEHSDHSTSSSALQEYRGGNLRVASQFAFEPSPSDPVITGGAQKLINVKVNPATQSSATFNDAATNPAMIVTSRDWGLFTSQINVAIAAGTNVGTNKVTVVFESASEVFDNIGGDPVLTVTYAGGFSTALLSIGASSLVAADGPTYAGLDTQRAADIAAPGVVNVVSTAGGDNSQTVTIYGLDGLNSYVEESIALNGLTPVAGLSSFATVLGAKLSAAAAGTVTVVDPAGPTTLFSFAPATLTRGISAFSANSPIVPSLSGILIDVGAPGSWAILEGIDANNVTHRQVFDLSAAVPQTITAPITQVTALYLGDVPGARTLTLGVTLFSFAYSSYSTVQKIVDALNAVPGVTAVSYSDAPETFAMTNVDVPAAPVAFVSPTVASVAADLYAVVQTLNDNSVLVSAARAIPGELPPANTVAPVYLTGGSEGTTTITQWQEAFRLLSKRRVNIIVPLTNDPAVHSLLRSHLNDRAGRLKSEANGYIGIGTNGGAGETRANITSQIRALNTRHISALSQECKRTHPDTGVSEWFPPWMFAVIAAGMQAGGGVGEPLTFKYPGVTDIRNDSSWSPEDDASDMIDLGLMFAESKDSIGIRFVRSITTYLVDDNLAFGEMSANASANTAVYELRRRVEAKVGRKGLAGSAAGIKGIAAAVLGELIDQEIIVAWRALTVEQVGDVFPISVEIAPVLPINFIPITVHLVAVRISA